MLRNVPLIRPQPDAKRFIDVLMGRTSGGRAPIVEYLVDAVVMRPILTDRLGRAWADETSDRASQKAYLDNFIQFWYRMGYDFVRVERGLGFPRHQLLSPDTAPGVAQDRAWADEHVGMIRNWDDLEQYPWPKIEDVDTCGARGRYALGSGNSIPSYIPVENYLAMIDEALET